MALLTPYWGLDGIVIFLSLMVAAYLYMTRKFKYWNKRGILEITPSPFVGNFSDLLLQRKSPGEFIKGLYDYAKGRPYMGFYIFDKPCFLVRDPELVKNVLVKDFSYFSNRYASADVDDRLGYANLFMIKNPAWKILRAKLTPIFTSGKLKKMFDLMTEIGLDLDRHLESLHLESAKEVEMKELCAKFTTDLIGTTAYGLRANSLEDPKAQFRQYGQKIFDYNFFRSLELSSIFFMPHWVKPMGSKFFGKDSSKFLRSVFWDTINERQASGVKRNDLIDLLIELKKNHEHEGDLGGFKFSGDDLVAQAAIFFTGGFETSSTAMSFTLYELALNREIQTKLRQEINDALEQSGGKVTYDLVTSLPYLDMVVSETLRKYPPLPFLDRCVVQDYRIPNSDVVLEKDTPVFISMTGAHYDEEYFPDSEKYDPERFNEENKRNRPSFTYFPFGEGPHVCIGLRLGLLQSKLGLIHMLKQYEFLPSKKTLTTMRFDPRALTTQAEGGLYLAVRKLTTEAG